MSIEDYVSQNYPIECKGRDDSGNEVLKTPVSAKVKIYKSPHSSTISSNIICKYNTGAHGQRCNVSSDQVICPYSFDIPYSLESKRQSQD